MLLSIFNVWKINTISIWITLLLKAPSLEDPLFKFLVIRIASQVKCDIL